MLKYDDLQLIQQTDKSTSSSKKFKTLNVKLKRIKTQSHKPNADEIIHFCHKDDISKCFIFSLFYNLVMTEDPTNEYLFPKWETHINLTKNGTDSHVSKEFNRIWAIMYKKSLAYASDISNKNPGEICQEDLTTMSSMSEKKVYIVAKRKVSKTLATQTLFLK